MVSLSSQSLQLISNAYPVQPESSAPSRAAAAGSSAQSGEDTYTPSSQSARMADGSATSFYSASSIAEPFYSSSVQLQATIGNTAAGEFATLELDGEKTGIDYITTYMQDGSILISPFGSFSYDYHLSIAASVSGSSDQVDTSLATSDVQTYLDTVRQEDTAITSSLSVSSQSSPAEPGTAGREP